jgi:hypothetical protein
MTGVLITRRSQVQILPPPPAPATKKQQVRGPFRPAERASPLTACQRFVNMTLSTHVNTCHVLSPFIVDMLGLYAGRSIEHGAIADLYDSPSHPYTRALRRRSGFAQPRPPLCLDGPRQATVAIFSYQAILTSTPGE